MRHEHENFLVLRDGALCGVVRRFDLADIISQGLAHTHAHLVEGRLLFLQHGCGTGTT